MIQFIIRLLDEVIMHGTSTNASIELDATGICVVRDVVPRNLVAAALFDVSSQIECMLALPGRSYGTRYFLRYRPYGNVEQKECQERSNFVPKWTKSHAELLASVLDGKVGDVITGALGGPPALSEITAIVAAPGTKAQTVHSDSNFEETAPRAITCFLALHDILEERMGPTKFYPSTHVPACFRQGKWLPPPDDHYRHPMAVRHLEDSKEQWFPLRAGDCVCMDHCCWHAGGANKSDRSRSLLSLTFVQKVS